MSKIRPVKITDNMNGLKIGPTGEFLQDAPNEKTSNWVCNRAVCIRCLKKDCIWMPRTNADRIRAMSDEELANVLSWLSDKKTADGWLDWLREEATE